LDGRNCGRWLLVSDAFGKPQEIGRGRGLRMIVPVRRVVRMGPPFRDTKNGLLGGRLGGR